MTSDLPVDGLSELREDTVNTRSVCFTVRAAADDDDGEEM